ncbi:MAG: hypothetical protein LZF62_340034 [Nitrospira sp.]|nr:MAG: hypothetical protein LZF62_340034 [Nitrospira sp.]
MVDGLCEQTAHFGWSVNDVVLGDWSDARFETNEQNGSSPGPQRAKERGVPLRYVERSERSENDGGESLQAAQTGSPARPQPRKAPEA